MVIKKGQVVVFTSGDYSDYTIEAIGKAVSTFDEKAVLKEYFQIHPEHHGLYEFNSYAFENWLMNEARLVEEIDYQEWNLQDSYGGPFLVPGPGGIELGKYGMSEDEARAMLANQKKKAEELEP